MAMSKEEKDIRKALERVNEYKDHLLSAMSDPMTFFIGMNAGRWAKIGVKYSSFDGGEWSIVELPYVTGTEEEADGSSYDTPYLAITPGEDRLVWLAVYGPGAPAQDGFSAAAGHEVTLTLKDGTVVRGDALFRLDRADVASRGASALFINCADGKNRLVVDGDVARCTVGGPADCSEKRLSAFIDKKCWFKDGTAPELGERVAEYGGQLLFHIFDDLRFIAATAGEPTVESALTALIGDGAEE